MIKKLYLYFNPQQDYIDDIKYADDNKILSKISDDILSNTNNTVFIMDHNKCGSEKCVAYTIGASIIPCVANDVKNYSVIALLKDKKNTNILQQIFDSKKIDSFKNYDEIHVLGFNSSNNIYDFISDIVENGKYINKLVLRTEYIIDKNCLINILELIEKFELCYTL